MRHTKTLTPYSKDVCRGGGGLLVPYLPPPFFPMNERLIEIAERVLARMKERHDTPVTWVTIAEDTKLDWRAVRTVLRNGGFAKQDANGLWLLLPHVPRLVQKAKPLD